MIQRDGNVLFTRGRSEHRDAKNKGKHWSKSKTKRKACYICHKENHFKKNFPELKKKSNGNHKKNGGQNFNSDTVDMTEGCNDESILDSGCTYHMTLDRAWFHTYREYGGGRVLLDNNKPCQVVGIGSIRIKLEEESTKKLQEVRQVPELERNQFSLGMFEKMVDSRSDVFHVAFVFIFGECSSSRPRVQARVSSVG